MVKPRGLGELSCVRKKYAPTPNRSHNARAARRPNQTVKNWLQSRAPRTVTAFLVSQDVSRVTQTRNGLPSQQATAVRPYKRGGAVPFRQIHSSWKGPWRVCASCRTRASVARLCTTQGPRQSADYWQRNWVTASEETSKIFRRDAA